ncbi:uncharacterized protein BcabD6B2_25400 [Babesia caballi]|uniref:NAD-specific glutamate dehydrogenase n=1 Tax=Babesia caballi TaxID=5871 RepID=A0AAV4LU55_BABCB|nr:hypothetical protein BcabD6B2_25400 [Babesia caballi]
MVVIRRVRQHGGILDHEAACQLRSVVQELYRLDEAGIVGLVLGPLEQLQHDRVIPVNFEDTGAYARAEGVHVVVLLVHDVGLDDLLHVRRHPPVRHHDGAGVVGQPVRELDIEDFADVLLDHLDQGRVLFQRQRILLDLLRSAFEVDVPLLHGLEGLALVVVELGDAGLVHGVGEVEDVDAALAEALQVGAAVDGAIRFATGVVDGLLRLGHFCDVLVKRYFVHLVLGGMVHEKLGNLLPVGGVVVAGDLQRPAEVLVELVEGGLLCKLLFDFLLLFLIRFRLELFLQLLLGVDAFLHQVLQGAQHGPNDLLTDDFNHLALLQVFTRDVEREVVAVDDTVEGVQVPRQKVGEAVRHEDPPGVYLDLVADVIVVEVGALWAIWNEQEGPEVDVSLRHEVDVREGLRARPTNGLVEGRVLLLRDLRLVPGPDGLDVVDVVPLGLGGALVSLKHVDGEPDELAVLLDQLLDLAAFEVLRGILLEEEGDLRTVLTERVSLGVLVELVLGVGRRLPDVLLVVPVLRLHDDAVGDEEDRVESDTELPDEVCVVFALGDGVNEVCRSRLGDSPQVVNQLVLGHTHTGIDNRERALGGRGPDPDRQLVSAVCAVFAEFENFVLFERIGGVGNKLPEEDLLVRVQRVDDNVHHTREVGLVRVAFSAFGRLGHFFVRQADRVLGLGYLHRTAFAMLSRGFRQGLHLDVRKRVLVGIDGHLRNRLFRDVDVLDSDHMFQMCDGADRHQAGKKGEER